MASPKVKVQQSTLHPSEGQGMSRGQTSVRQDVYSCCGGSTSLLRIVISSTTVAYVYQMLFEHLQVQL